MPATLYALLFLTLVAWPPVVLSQQPAHRWSHSFGAPGVNGSVGEILLHGDSLVVAGAFSVAGTTVAHNIAILDRSTQAWATLSPDTDVRGSAIAVDENGRIFVAGYFTTGSEAAVQRIAAWDGTRWRVLREETSGVVRALVAGQDRLYAAVSAPRAGGETAIRISEWNGTAWRDLEGDLASAGSDASLYALALDADGYLYAGGRFDHAGAVRVTSLARWDGMRWEELGAGLSSTDAFGAVVFALRWKHGRLLVGGDFTHAGGKPARNLAAWDGQGWQPLGGGMPEGPVTAIDIAPGGTVYVAGSFSGRGTLAVLRESGWEYVAMPGRRIASAIQTVDEKRVIVGSWAPVLPDGDNPSQFLFEWDGTAAAWRVLDERTNGLDGPVYALVSDGGGGFYAGGHFDFAGAKRANSVAHWNGAAWEALGEGLPGRVYALARASDGTLYAGGRFQGNGDRTFRHIARWNGSTWERLGEGMSLPTAPALEEVRALALAYGKLYVGGTFTVAGSIASPHLGQWDLEQKAWEVPPGSPDGAVATLSTDAGGRLYVGGRFQAISSEPGYRNIAMWDGAAWHQMGNGSTDPVTALAWHGTRLFASGGYAGQTVASWDGEAWIPAGDDGIGGDVRALSLMPNGQLFAGGKLSGTHDCRRGGEIEAAELAFFDGTSWCAVEEPGIGGHVVSALLAQSTDLVIGGEFTFVDQSDARGGYFYGGGIPSSNLAVLHDASHVSREDVMSGAPRTPHLSIFPNPTSGPVHLSYTVTRSGPVEILVWDMLGRLVSRQHVPVQFEGDHEFVFEHPPRTAGAYVVDVRTPTHRITRSLVILQP